MKDIIFPITYKSDQKGLKEAETQLSGFGTIAAGAFAKIGSMAVEALSNAVTGLVSFGTESLQAAAHSEAIAKGLENAAKNAGTFGSSSASIKSATDALDKHSRKLGEMSGIDDEVINQLKSAWLAVPSIASTGVDGINKLAQVTADVAKGTGKDISAIAMMFTKTAGDQETALSKLNRAGVVLSDSQKQVYNDLLAVGDEAGAQAYLIDQLGQKYAGMAEATANPFERMKVIFDNFKEDIGAKLMPVLDAVLPKIQDLLGSIISDPDFVTFLNDITDAFISMLPDLESTVKQLWNLAKEIMPGLNPLMDSFGSILGIVSTGMKNTSTNGYDMWVNFKNIAEILDFINKGLKDWNDFFTDVVDNAGAMGPVLEGIFNAIKNAIDPVGRALQSVVDLIRWINGTPVKATGIRYNNNGSIDHDGNPATPFALGGIVTSPTHALIGEAGPEAVIPLDKFQQVTGIGGGGITVNVNAGMGVDGAALGEQIVTAIRKFERTSGKVFAAA